MRDIQVTMTDIRVIMRDIQVIMTGIFMGDYEGKELIMTDKR